MKKIAFDSANLKKQKSFKKNILKRYVSKT